MSENGQIKNHFHPADRPAFGADDSHVTPHVHDKMIRYFARFDVKTDYLKDLLARTVGKILQSGIRSNVCFGTVVEGRTISGGIAEVTGDRCIRIDTRQLMLCEDAVAMALLAHELAHDHLGHFRTWQNNLDQEQSADNLAEQWGFRVDQMRRMFGPPSLNSRLQQIAVIR